MRLFFLTPALLAAGTTGLIAQPIQSSMLTGRVTDRTGGVLPGARVTAFGSHLIGGPRTVATDAAGIYRLNVLPAGAYDIDVEHTGFGQQRLSGIRLPGETTLTIDFELELAPLSQGVTVTARAPIVDVTSPSAATKLDEDLLNKLPTRRVLADVINLAPGVAGNVGFGGVQNSNLFQVDGVDVSDPQELGPWSAFNYNWVQEVQVVALGAPAQYDGFSGVVSSAILRSGSNRFSGLAEYWTTRPNWVGRNTSSLSRDLQQQFAPRRTLSLWDSSLQFGGPIWRDHVWFFSGVQYSRNEFKPFGYSGEASTNLRDRRVLAKLTAAPSSSTRLEGFVEHDRYDIEGAGLGPFTLLEATNSNRRPDTNWNVHLTWRMNDRTLVEVRDGGFSGTWTFDPRPPATRSGPFAHIDLTTGMSSGNTTDYYDFGRSRNVFSVVLTRDVNEAWGRHHDLKLGLEHERARVTSTAGIPGGRYYLDEGGQPSLVVFQEPFTAHADPHRVGMFAQDRWELNRHLTFELGVRVNANRGTLRGQTFFRTNPVSPRLGVAWDLGDNHRTVIRAHYGRYHEALLSAQFSFMDPVGGPPRITAAVVGPDQFTEIDRSTDDTRDGMDPNLRHAYLDQALIGLERELLPNLSLQVQYVHRSFEKLMGFIDTGSVYTPLQRRDPGPDGQVGTADDGDLVTVFSKANPGNEFYYFTNPPGSFRRYDALQLIARKRFSRNWQLLAAYTWSKTRGTLDNTLRANSLGPENGFNGVSADPNRAINADGPTSFDFTHEIKAMGTYRIPLWGGLNVSGVYRYHTGVAWGRMVRFNGDGIPFNIFGVRVEPRGTRRLPAISQLDLNAEKTMPLRASTRTQATLSIFCDVFNVSNQGVPDSNQFPPVVVHSGSAFGRPRVWTDPRALRLGARLRF